MTNVVTSQRAALEVRGLSAARVVKGGVGHVPEGRQLFPLMTVREKLRGTGAELLRHPRVREAYLSL